MEAYLIPPTRLSLAIAIAVSSFVTTTANAQDENFELEEVTVYAQKREQSIMEVPVSVSSYNAELIATAQVRDLNDLQQLAPSLTVNASSGGMESIFSIRGIGTAGQNAGLEQSVGVFIDGVYRGRPASALNDYVGVNGIEVLKGPQGTLFGRNTSAGVISVRTEKPSHEFGGEIELSAGSEGYLQTKAIVTGGLSDTIAGNFAVTYQERDGTLDDVVTSEDYNDRDRYTLRAQLLWDINDDTSLRLIADYTDTDEVCCNAAPLFYGPAQGAIALTGGTTLTAEAPTTYQLFTGNYAEPFNYDVATTPNTSAENVKDWGLSGELNWNFGETALTLIGAYRKHENYNFLDADFTDLQLFDRENIQDIDETSLEIRWVSTGSQNVDWTLGLFYFKQKNDYRTGLFFGEDSINYANVLAAALSGGNPLVDTPFSDANAGVNFLFNRTGTWWSADDKSVSNTDYEAESMALFGQATWNITTDLSLSVGLRYSDEEKEGDFDWTGDYAFGEVPSSELVAIGAGALAAFQTGSPYDSFTTDYDDDDISATVSVNYQFSEAFSMYGRFAQGYKSGGINMDRSAPGQAPGNPTPDPEGTHFDAETVDSFEIGFKSRLFENRLTINGAVFYQELDDYQQNSFDGLNFTVRNAATVESEGIEFAYTFAPNERWLFSGGISFQNVEYDQFENASPTAWQGAQGATEQDLSGEPVLFTSDTTLAGIISYTIPINDSLSISMATTYAYSSEYYTGQDNDPITEQDSYWIYNVNFSLIPADDRWQIDLWGKNIGDEEVVNIVFDTPLQSGSYHAYVREPMTWGMTGKLRF